MEIRNRIANIKTLQAHILQDYFSMALVASFIDDTWEPILSCEVQKSVNSKYSRSYVGAWDKMQLKEMDNYSVDDMDRSNISKIEHQTRIITDYEVIGIARALGMSILDLYKQSM